MIAFAFVSLTRAGGTPVDIAVAHIAAMDPTTWSEQAEGGRMISRPVTRLHMAVNGAWGSIDVIESRQEIYNLCIDAGISILRR